MAKPEPSQVDVLFSTVDQQSPKTARPLGRLASLVNSKIRKFQNPRAADGTVTHVKVEKRDGFTSLSSAVQDLDGNAANPIAGSPQLFHGASDAARVVVGNRLYTRTGAGWVKASSATAGDERVFPQTLRSGVAYAADSQAQAPDIATIGDVQCLAWREIAQKATDDTGTTPTTASALDGVRVQFQTKDGAIRPAVTLNPQGGATDYHVVRAFAYLGQFYVVQDYSTGTGAVRIWVTVFNAAGKQLAQTQTSALSGNQYWDATVIPSDGMTIAEPNNGSGVRFTTLVYAGSFTTSTNTDTRPHCGGKQVAWLTDDSGTAHQGRLATVDGATNASAIWAYTITSRVYTHEFPQVVAGIDQTATWISGITGYAVPGVTSLLVSYSLMNLTTSVFDGTAERTIYLTGTNDRENDSASDHFPDQLANQVYCYTVPFTGASTLLSQRWAMSLATRAFALNGDYVAIGYFPARKFGPLETTGATSPHFPQRPANPSNFQPCWYVLPLAAPQNTQQGYTIAGRFEYGLATADYQVCAYDNTAAAIIAGPRNRFLSNIGVLSNGALALALGYRAEQNIPESTLFSGQTRTGGNAFGWISGLSYSSDNTVGIKVFTIGPDCGTAFVANGTTYLPGLLAGIVESGDVEMTEQGLAAVECPSVTRSLSSTTPSAEGAYQFRFVAEYTSRGGKTCRSLPSAAFSYKALIADGKGLDLLVHNVAPTLKRFVKLSAYRTGYVNATVTGTGTVTDPPTTAATTTLTNAATVAGYKISSDLTPFYNDPRTQFATFTDYLEAGTQGTGEMLYTDQGFLPRFPAPAHRGGCVWQNRAWLIGYDNALWFSGEMAEGEAEWFNPGQRVPIPANEEIIAIASLDSFLVVFCERSVWTLPEGAALPDNTGAGTIPAAVRLPFEMGSVGRVAVIREGVVYPSSAGGVWIVTRGLENQWFGQLADDELAGQIDGILAAGNNVYIQTQAALIVYDTNVGGWAQWVLPGLIEAIAVFDGLPMAFMASTAWKQVPGDYFDREVNSAVNTFIAQSGEVAPVHIGGVRNWKRTWEIQMQGETYDSTSLQVTLNYGDYSPLTATYDAKVLTPGAALELPIRPTLQLATSVGIAYQEVPTGFESSGQGFSLEALGFYIGVEKGMKKTAAAARAKAT